MTCKFDQNGYCIELDENCMHTENEDWHYCPYYQMIKKYPLFCITCHNQNNPNICYDCTPGLPSKFIMQKKGD